MAPNKEEDDDNSFDTIDQIPEDLLQKDDTAVVENPDNTYSVIPQEQWEGE